MIRPDIESLYFTSNGEVSIQAVYTSSLMVYALLNYITGIIGQFMNRLYKFNTC